MLRSVLERGAPDGFQIWGIPSGAKSVLKNLAPGDYLLLLEAIGPGGTFAYGGSVIARPSRECFTLSTHLWGEGRFPIILFLHDGLTNFRWYEFCDNLGYKRNWNPAGNTYRITEERFQDSPYGEASVLLHRMLGFDPSNPVAGPVDDYFIQDPVELDEAEEGRKRLREHLHTERSAKLVAAFKRQLKSFACAACGFDFEKVYGTLGQGFIECHHTVPVSQMIPGQKTSMSTLVPVCSNCHRMLHRKLSTITVSDLKRLLADQFAEAAER